jgi:hypothetical protein
MMKIAGPERYKLCFDADKGKYLTIFTKQSDKSWKAIADTFNSDSPG